MTLARVTWMATAIGAVAVPLLVALNLPPSPTLVNQILSLVGWGALLVMMGMSPARREPRDVLGSLPIWLGLGALGVAMLWSPASGGLPWAIGMSGIALLGAAGLVAEGIKTQDCAHANHRVAFNAVAVALLCAGLISVAIGIVQVFAPALADGSWIATPSAGRATGNVRQPNHLASLLLWSMIAAVWLQESGKVRGWQGWTIGASLLFGVVLTASRTGLIGTVLLAAWGLTDRRLSRSTRLALGLVPLLYGLAWAALGAWAQHDPRAFAGEARLSHGGDLSSSRFAIWSNTLEMIRREPLNGIGYGEFNIAWTLTEFPDRPVAFFDHTHNLPLQLLVELGIPLGSLVIVLLLVALVQAGRRAWACDGHEGAARRAAFMIVLMIGLHSMLEYPLWYAYFLLPTAFAWGFALSPPITVEATAPRAQPTSDDGTRVNRTLAFAGMALAIGGAAAMLDYWRVVVIYDPPEFAAPLEERIERGQRSPLFGHHADYAAATAFGEPKAPLSPSQQLAFKRAPHQLLDVRLMIAWSQALAAQGEMDKARWLAARIREFRNPGADEYFAPCQRPDEAARAFQCQPPQRVVHWREFTQ